MIIGIGIDSVEIARLIPWTKMSKKQLSRIFSPEEIAYSFQSPLKTPERLAARFAAREACFKALSLHCSKPLPFLTLCRALHLKSLPSGAPVLIVDWQYLSEKGYFKPFLAPRCHISLTHTRTTATAIVILECN